MAIVVCNGCREEILWLKSNVTGALAAIEATPDENGNVVILPGEPGEAPKFYARVKPKKEIEGRLFAENPYPELPRHHVHFARCKKERETFRKRDPVGRQRRR